MSLLPIKLLGSLAVAGLVAAGGTAFTATGVSSDAAVTQAVGLGTVTQLVTGAVVSTVTYTNPGASLVTKVTVTFATALQTGSAVHLDAFTGNGVALTNNTNLVPTGNTNPIYEFALNAGPSDGAGTDDLTGIAVRVG